MILRTLLALVLALPAIPADNPERSDQLVDLNVVAVDKHGQPVMDLAPDEFKVLDSGKPQKIVFFRHNDTKIWQVPSLGPNEFSNRRGANISRATVILFDLMNERFGTRGVAANQIVHALESLESADYLYIYFLTLDGQVVPVHGLPGGEVTESGEGPWTKQIKRIMDDSLRAVMRTRPPDIDVAVRVQLTFRALDRLALTLARIPGRKNIVWITDGVPISLGPRRSDTGDFVDFTPQFRLLGAAMDRAGIAIYPVRQVMLGSPDAMGAGPGAGATGAPGAAGGITGMGSIESLAEFADMTGGRPDAGKDIGAAVQQAMSDVRTSYQIGYYRTPQILDSKYHKLRVTCTRKDVRMQSKTGYFAWPEPPGARAQQAIEAAASTTFDAAEIGLRATLSPDAKGGRVAHVEARIEAHDIALVQDGDRYTAQLRVALVDYGADRPPAMSTISNLDVNYSAGQRDQVLKDGISCARDLKLSENAKALRLIVFDRGSNTVGSISMPIAAQ